MTAVPPTGTTATALVLAAGSSRRLGEPKQLLPFRDATLLDATLGAVRALPVGQRIVTLGGSADDVRREVDLTGFDVVTVADHGTGCSASIVRALEVVRPDADGIVLLLGDQPRLRRRAVDALLVAAAAGATLAVASYEDGRGHPMWLGRAVFDELADLHGDKGVWRLLDRHGEEVVDVDVDGRVPADVDTRQDYTGLLAGEAARG